MKISLHGSYFGNNYGDVLLMKMFTQWVREYDPSITINYPKLKQGLILDPPENATSGLWNLIKSDALVFFGGGYFGEKPTRKIHWSVRNFFRHVIVGLIAVFFRIPYAIIGVEFGPLSVSWFRRCVLFIAKHAKYLVVRNVESELFLKENGVKNVILSCDAVLSLSDIVRQEPDCVINNKILLHITRQNSKVIALLKAVIIVMKEQHINRVGFIEDEPGQYSRFSNNDEGLKLFEDAGIMVDKYEYEGTNKVIETIKGSEMIITTKLHVGITGVALNKKVFSVYIHPKTLRLHKQVNNEKNCISLNEVDDSTIDRIRAFFKEGHYFLPSSVLEASRENKKILYNFLDAVR